MEENYFFITLLGFLLRWCVSLFPYSGAGTPPLFGDYEAQRHWQEVTYNLPVIEWYQNTTRNDLSYWGLDYPPLTAYHSYLSGLVAHGLNPMFVELFLSRGFESYNHKLFMRYTVFVADLIIYLPASLAFVMCMKSKMKFLTYQALLLYPGIFLIDYGHFQYNCVSLGLFTGAVAAFLRNRDLLGSILFCLALNYKQMELYHAMPIFCYLLGKCLRQKSVWNCGLKLVTIGAVVLVTFSLIWSPFLFDLNLAKQVIHRLFPIGRGVFEDKVASVWCSLSVVIKLKNLFTNDQMALLALVTTAVAMLPSSIHLLWRASHCHLKYALLNVSLVFFLFSYHVHEKSILLANIAAILMFSEDPFMVVWFLIVSLFSMLPLLIKDGLVMPLLSLTVFTLLVFKNSVLRMSENWYLYALFWTSLLGLLILTICTLFLEPPPNLPDLFAVLISIYSCSHFCLFLFYFHFCQFTVESEYMHNHSKKLKRY